MSDLISNDIVAEMFAIKKEISLNKKWGFNIEEKDFIKGMLFLTPQSYGPRLEAYIKNKVDFKKIKPSDNKGDISNNNLSYEVKTSILTPTNNALNLVQIRLFQKVDFYFCVAYDMRALNDYKKYMFLLTHDDMVEETKNASSAHGTKYANKKNKNIELRLSINCCDNDQVFKTWKNKYQIKDYKEIINV